MNSDIVNNNYLCYNSNYPLYYELEGMIMGKHEHKPDIYSMVSDIAQNFIENTEGGKQPSHGRRAEVELKAPPAPSSTTTIRDDD